MCPWSVMSNSLRPHGLQSARLLCPWHFPGKTIVVSCHFLCKGIFLTHGLNLHLLHLLNWQVDCLPVSHPRSSLGGIKEGFLDWTFNKTSPRNWSLNLYIKWMRKQALYVSDGKYFRQWKLKFKAQWIGNMIDVVQYG